LKDFDFDNIDYDLLQEIIQHSVNIKEYFVSNDLTENNIRKALNFGHTVGHAFESLAMQQKRPILHGYAVAFGMIAELFLSIKKCNFPSKDIEEITNWLLQVYGKFEIQKSDYDQLFELMTHDKKNDSGRINFTLIPEIGKIEINQNCEKKLIFEALDYYRNL
jgi:3-dehydroquinate synthase